MRLRGSRLPCLMTPLLPTTAAPPFFALTLSSHHLYSTPKKKRTEMSGGTTGGKCHNERRRQFNRPRCCHRRVWICASTHRNTETTCAHNSALTFCAAAFFNSRGGRRAEYTRPLSISVPLRLTFPLSEEKHTRAHAISTLFHRFRLHRLDEAQ